MSGRRIRWAVAPAALIAAGVAAAGRPSNSPGQAQRPGSATVTCSFSNPGYSGYCRETGPVPSGSSGGRVCAGILGCLNDTRCAKTYCGATQVRGGWRVERIETRTAPGKPATPVKGS